MRPCSSTAAARAFVPPRSRPMAKRADALMQALLAF
jgi:hypothetical protein